MTETFVASDQLARLKDFQRDTVRHVVRRMYEDAEPTRRFLVADETGLGKSVVARGVVAEMVERLLADDSVERIDVVYVCSNADIAAQNLSRLNVVGKENVEFRTRLTMLAAHTEDLNSSVNRYGKAVNLIAFTPATSFEKGWRTGRASERALLAILLERMLGLSGHRRTGLHRVLQGGVHSLERFRGRIAEYESRSLDVTISEAFTRALRGSALETDLETLLAEVGQRRSLDAGQADRARSLIGSMRDLLARASVHALQPDLIILDEFQRFRELLNPSSGPAAELAHHLFEWPEARTLLLSATPYKPFTVAEEDADGQDHYSDFMTTLSFLATHDEGWLAAVRSDLITYRSQLLGGLPSQDTADRLQALLLQFMCRTERPIVQGAHVEVATTADAVTARDLLDYVGLQELARAVDGQMQVEYWKSAPYFVNFLDGYQVGEHLKARLKQRSGTTAVQAALARVSRLDAAGLEQFQGCDMGNARLRSLADRTVGQDWWQLLWIPASMPYTTPGGPYGEPFAADVTKQLVFSSWSATPTAIAGLLSYDAERRLAEGSTRLTENTAAARRRLSTRLDYRVEAGRAGAMSTLALFWPHPALATLADSLAAARQHEGGTLPVHQLQSTVLQMLEKHGTNGPTSRVSTDVVADFFAWPGGRPALSTRAIVDALGSSLHAEDQGAEIPEEGEAVQPHGVRLAAHVEQALAATEMALPSADLAELAAFAPGSAAWLALGRVVLLDDQVTGDGHWAAASVLANGLRSLFNRVESTLLLDRLYPDLPYWRAVLAYCRDGNLQAVLDEYVHHLRSTVGDEVLTDQSLRHLATAAAGALSMRPSRYVAFDPENPSQGLSLGSRFALRYGSPRGRGEDVRLPEVRAAFNSPFWPFVLTTTSAGQEGIDFHWWCHSVVHWNTPSNPVDFEQREGRVNRFGGHAVRRNLAAAHRSDAMGSSEPDPWRAAYDAGKTTRPDLGDFCPYWVYPGPHAVQRHLLPFPLSRDLPRAEALKRDLTHYRLALGQPRQEDFLAALARNGGTGRPLDLRPPIRPHDGDVADVG